MTSSWTFFVRLDLNSGSFQRDLHHPAQRHLCLRLLIMHHNLVCLVFSPVGNKYYVLHHLGQQLFHCLLSVVKESDVDVKMKVQSTSSLNMYLLSASSTPSMLASDNLMCDILSRRRNYNDDTRPGKE